ncbi:hypothetical protein TNIN_1711 [Trichonephila inaurata madagascariensis]|uniref:Uncharacterized protein n=1 Tax=Trichonephila inaurata madagascariensis TaxID=2747483 RepID=A0A8X7CST8_9ARAC|nr:hypothetical protein TNIN_1711 [Trichonephila inaurata madagascariensis]
MAKWLWHQTLVGRRVLPAKYCYKPSAPCFDHETQIDGETIRKMHLVSIFSPLTWTHFIQLRDCCVDSGSVCTESPQRLCARTLTFLSRKMSNSNGTRLLGVI